MRTGNKAKHNKSNCIMPENKQVLRWNTIIHTFKKHLSSGISLYTCLDVNKLSQAGINELY